MTLVAKIADPYADALFELARSKNILKDITKDIRDLYNVFSSVPEMMFYMTNPIVSSDKKKEVFGNIFGSEINPEILKFLKFLIDRRRFNYFFIIADKFLELVGEFEGIKIVKFRTVVPLSYKQEEELINKLKELTGSKEIRIVHTLDKSILGGLMLQIDSQVIDISLKGQLRQISKNLESNLVI